MSSENQPSSMPRLILGTRKVNFVWKTNRGERQHLVAYLVAQPSARVLNP